MENLAEGSLVVKAAVFYVVCKLGGEGKEIGESSVGGMDIKEASLLSCPATALLRHPLWLQSLPFRAV